MSSTLIGSFAPDSFDHRRNTNKENAVQYSESMNEKLQYSTSFENIYLKFTASQEIDTKEEVPQLILIVLKHETIFEYRTLA